MPKKPQTPDPVPALAGLLAEAKCRIQIVIGTPSVRRVIGGTSEFNQLLSAIDALERAELTLAKVN